MKNILVVGGAGYVGGAVVDLLKVNDFNVRVYDLLLYEDHYFKNVDFIFGDIRDKEKLAISIEWADVVIWIAALVGDGACDINKDVTYQINTEALKVLTNFKDKRTIFFSTCSVYGINNNLIDEKAEVNPLSTYAQSKIEAEKIINDSNSIIFRLGTLFGVGDRFSRVRFDLVLNTLTMYAFQKKEINVFGGEQYRPLLHVKDAAKTILEACNHDKCGTYNICKENTRIVDLANEVQENFEDIKVNKIDQPFQDLRNYRVDCSKAINDLGFNPKLSFSNGISEIKNLLTEGRVKDLYSTRYINMKFISDDPIFK